MLNILDLVILGFQEIFEVAFDAKPLGEVAIRPALALRKTLLAIRSNFLGAMGGWGERVDLSLHHLRFPLRLLISVCVALFLHLGIGNIFQKWPFL